MTKTIKLLTSDQVAKAGASDEMVARFERMFPQGVVPSVAICKSYASSFDWDWAAQNLLPPKGLVRYKAATARALAKRDESVAVAWAQYEAVVNQPMEYMETSVGMVPTVASWARHKNNVAFALDNHRATIGQATGQYKADKAVAWAKQWAVA